MYHHTTLVQLNADLQKVYKHIEDAFQQVYAIEAEIRRLERVVQNTGGWTVVHRAKTNKQSIKSRHTLATHHTRTQYSLPTSNRFHLLENPVTPAQQPTVPLHSKPLRKQTHKNTHAAVSKKQEKANTISGPVSAPCENNALSHKQNILILADSHGRNMSSTLRELLPSNYAVTGIFKPNARMADVISELDTHTQQFTVRDTVVIIGGQNDINLGGQFQPRDHIPKIQKVAQRTNVIMTTLPPWHNNTPVNNAIKKANINLTQQLRETQITLLNLSLSDTLFTRHGLHLRQAGKYSLGSIIASHILKVSRTPASSSAPSTTVSLLSPSTPASHPTPFTPVSPIVPSTTALSPAIAPAPAPAPAAPAAAPATPVSPLIPSTRVSSPSPSASTPPPSDPTSPPASLNPIPSYAAVAADCSPSQNPPSSPTRPKHYNLRTDPKPTQPLSL